LAVHNSGAYGLTASPVHFISHPLPEEVLVMSGALLRATRTFSGSCRAPVEEAVRLVDSAHPAAANQNA